MPTDTDNVRLLGQTGSDRCTVRTTRLTQRRQRLPNNNAFDDGFSPIKTLVIAGKMPTPKAWVSEMKRREFIALVGTAAGWPLTARANPIPRVGYIEGSRPTPWMSDLLGALSDLGYVDGKNIIFVKLRIAGPTVQAMKDAISEIQPDIDLLVVGGTVGGVAAKSAAAHIPVVFVSVGAPVDIGLVDTLAHPGGNMTGTTFEANSETDSKRLQILKEILPNLSRVVVLGAMDDPNFPFAMRSLTQAAPDLRVSITPIEFGSAGGLGGAFKEMNAAHGEALIV